MRASSLFREKERGLCRLPFPIVVTFWACSPKSHQKSLLNGNEYIFLSFIRLNENGMSPSQPQVMTLKNKGPGEEDPSPEPRPSPSPHPQNLQVRNLETSVSNHCFLDVQSILVLNVSC